MAMGVGGYKQGMRKSKGDVKINGISAKIGDLVKVGDVVSTGPNSFAVFVVGKDAFLLRSESTVTLDYEATDELKVKVINVIKMMNGKMLSVFGRGNKRMITPTAVIGIRGTAAYVEAEPIRTYVCTCYGRSELAAIAAPEVRESIRTKYHDAPRYICSQGADQLIVPAPVINHTDEELIMLEELVWRRPPFLNLRSREGGGNGGGGGY